MREIRMALCMVALVCLCISFSESIQAQSFPSTNVNANGLNLGRYGGSYLGDSNPFAIFHSDGTRNLYLLGNDAASLSLRLLDGDLKIGISGSSDNPLSTFYNNGSMFLGGDEGNRLTIGGSTGKLNFRIGTWVSLSETGSGFATVLGNNIQSSTSSNNYLEYMSTTSDGARAIKMQYDEGITFHTKTGSVTAGNQMTSSEQMRITNAGNVGIGTTSPTYKLEVNGTIRTKEIIVQVGWPDYVFASDYPLPPLEKIEAYIKQYHHLPDVPSAAEVEKDGVKLAEMNAILLKKIEELTLYMIDLKKQNDTAMEEIEKLKAGEKK